MCFGCLKELSHRDGSFEYPQHMFWLGNKKNNFQLHTLIWELVSFISIILRLMPFSFTTALGPVFQCFKMQGFILSLAATNSASAIDLC